MTIIFFATNRQLLPTGELGVGFHPDVDDLRYGMATVGCLAELDEDIPNRTRRDTYWRLG